jgi:pimeloyl-ACP methyl ester carboxylesterase
MTREFLNVAVPGGRLAAEHWPGPDPALVLLHSGVTDRRSWYETAGLLTDRYAMVAYDRRGFGQSLAAADAFTHVGDLWAVLDGAGIERAWLVGSSAGGAVALDAALTYPDRVVGLVLLAPAVSGAPGGLTADPETERLDALIDAAVAAGDLDEANRLEAWLWLDGPAQPEGRVGGTVRDLFLEMNAIALRSEAESADGHGDGAVSAWSRLAEITAPVLVAWGELDIAVLNDRCRQLVERLPAATGVELPGVAHLPYLEDPAAVADLVRRHVWA